uniref:NEDD4-binding protein 2-like 1 n=1 Tax=Neogobius melanostomus TaxID=47308 RepID=A0A8C6S8E3_9GOBI
MTWNIKAPVFYPQIQGNQCPAFITPVASNWPREPRPTVPWHRPSSQAQMRPCPPIPVSWALPPPQPLGHYKLHLEGNVLVMLRGPPGSGKSTLARALLEHNPGGVILSTDDYFDVNGQYCFDPAVLGEAHSWNHNRAKLAFERGANPIIIDNTNMQGWEMRPYVVQALKYHYKVFFREPDTWWKNKPRELERRTRHGVPSERIRRMLCGYERFVSVKSILGSQMPKENKLQLKPGKS